MTHDELCRMEQSKLIKLIDEGKLIYLPCKVGKTVYCIYKDRLQDVKKVANEQPKPFYKVKENTIRQIMIDCNNELRLFFDSIYPATEWTKNIGKTVFLTREEAEKSIKGA